MTRVKPGQRKRAFKPKSKTGCATCKLRRLKCDETKPECLKCVTSGRKCEGYPTTNSTTNAIADAKYTAPQFQDPITSLIKVHGEYSRGFQFFFERTLDDINSIFPESLWSTTVPTLSQSEPSIKHAVLALSDFHENFASERRPSTVVARRPSHDRGLAEYNQAIAQLLGAGPGNPPHADIYLVSCVVFISIEFLRGNYSAAISLAHHGLKMSHDLRDPSRAAFYTTQCSLAEREELLPKLDHYFKRVDLQIYTSAWMSPCISYSKLPAQVNGLAREGDHPDDDVQSRLVRIGLDPNKPAYYPTVVKAREAFEDAFYIYMSSKNRPGRNSAQDFIKDSKALMAFFERFSAGLDELQENRSDTWTAQDSIGFMALDMQRRLFRSTAQVGFPKTHVEWDAQIDNFAKVVEQGERVLGVEPPPPAAFSLEIRSRSPSTRLSSVVSDDSTMSGSSSSGSSPADTSSLPRSHSQRPSQTPDLNFHFPHTQPRVCYIPDLIMLPMLFSALQRCRDPGLRRRIIRMLYISNRQEGFNDGLLIAVIGERMLEIEEINTPTLKAADIPAESRLHAIWVRLDDGVCRGGLGAVVEFERAAAGGVPPPSPTGLSTMIADDDPDARIYHLGKGDPAKVVWLERVKWGLRQ